MADIGSIGIDFGTTKTSLAYATSGGRPKVEVSLPTSVLFAAEKNRTIAATLFGKDALESPALAWHSFKLYMGRETVPAYICRDTPLPADVDPPAPHYLGALIFHHLRLRFLQIRNLPEHLEVGPVTITVPAESTFQQRQATVFAASVAGFRDISVLEEPVAAYLRHRFDNSSLFDTRDEFVSLIIDFGGGTCDMAIIQSKSGTIPIVLNTRTLAIGGKDIDDAIVGHWISQGRLNIRLPERGQFPEEVTTELKRLARLTKEFVNPRVSVRDVPDLLLHPLATQFAGSLPASQRHLTIDGELLEPPELNQDDFDAIMPDFLSKIDAELDILLGDLGPHAVQHVILAGGSAYIRQFIDFVRTKMGHLERSDRHVLDYISFTEPENDIAYGALEFQRNDSEGKETVYPRLAMSTYLEVDYNHERDISPRQRSLSGVPFIRYGGKSYVELASKGKLLTSRLPRLRPTPENLMYIPVSPDRKEIHWKVFQVRRVAADGKDYKALSDETKPVDEIRITLRRKTKLPIALSYAFDIYGDFYRVARPYLALKSRFQSQWEKAPQFDWRDRALLRRTRQEFFDIDSEGSL